MSDYEECSSDYETYKYDDEGNMKPQYKNNNVDDLLVYDSAHSGASAVFNRENMSILDIMDRLNNN